MIQFFMTLVIKKIDENEKFKMKLFNLTKKFHEHSDGIIANSKKLI